MALLNLTMKNDFFCTPIPNCFIDHYMLKANAVYANIYIYAFRHCFYNTAALTTKDIAKAMNIMESDVLNAWEYWESEKLIKLNKAEGEVLSVEFLQIAPQPEAIIEETIPEVKPAVEPKKKFLLESRPEYSVQELEVYQTQSEEINYLFTYAEKSLGKTLKYSDLNLIFSLYDWLRLPLIVIEKLLSYCSENGHTNMNYIEAVAIDWAQRGIDSAEAADDYIQTFNKDFKEILKAFGQASRKPTPKESEFLEKWLKVCKMAMPVILEACDKTMMALGKINMKYTDKIITSWAEANVKTIEDIKKLDDEFYKNDSENSKTKRTAAPKKNRFVNFEGRKLDYNELEKMEQEYINKKANATG